MSDELLDRVNEELMPFIEPLGFRVLSSEVADSFDNASVILGARALRLRVVRERSIIFLDIGPPSEPGTWFDSAVVMDHLGLSSDAGFHDADTTGVLRGAGAFVTSMWVELTSMFGAVQLHETKRTLKTLAEERAGRLFGN